MYLDSDSKFSHSQEACFILFPHRAYLAYTSVFLWLVAKAWPGAIYQNNLLSGGNLLLTDKSLPSVGCNGSHLSFFSEYCPSRPPPRQTQLNDCSLFHSSSSKSTAAASHHHMVFKSQIQLGQLRWSDAIPPWLRNVITVKSVLFCTDQLSSLLYYYNYLIMSQV